MSGRKDNKAKLTRKSISLDVKMQVLRRLENGERQVDIGNALNLPTSTIRTILKNRDKIKMSATATLSSSAANVTRSRSNILEEMEKRLCIWIDHEIDRNMPLSQKIIMQKGINIFKHIQNEREDTSESFTASRGWFDNFKKRSNLYNVRVTREEANADTAAASVFHATLQPVIEKGKYPPELVFNVDETEFFWKRMPKHTFISREENRAPHIEAAEECFSLLLGGNASGDFKLKPLLVYHSKTPGTVEGLLKSCLPVICAYNKKKSCITRDIFQNWFTAHFCPSVKHYCERNKFEPKALLLLDNALSHSINVSGLSTCVQVEIVFLPSNITSLVQPMDQGVITNFKARYLRRIIQQLMDRTGEDKKKIFQCWKKYNILDAIANIDVAWQELPKACMNGAWKKIWPVVSQDYREEPIARQIVNLIHEAGLGDVNEDDIEEMLQVSDEGLTNDDLEDLAVRGIEEGESSGSGDGRPKKITTNFLKKSVETITEVVDQIVAHDPNFDRSSRARRGVLEAISCYRNLLNERKRKREMIQGKFFAKKPVMSIEPKPLPQT